MLTATRLFAAALLAATMLLTACCGSRAQPPPDHLVTFDTSTSRDGLRFFTYQVEMPRMPDRAPLTAGNARPADVPSGVNPRGRDRQRFNESLDLGLSLKLEETGYCPGGFLILDRYTLPGRATIRGECL